MFGIVTVPPTRWGRSITSGCPWCCVRPIFQFGWNHRTGLTTCGRWSQPGRKRKFGRKIAAATSGQALPSVEGIRWPRFSRTGRACFSWKSPPADFMPTVRTIIFGAMRRRWIAGRMWLTCGFAEPGRTWRGRRCWA